MRRGLMLVVVIVVAVASIGGHALARPRSSPGHSSGWRGWTSYAQLATGQSAHPLQVPSSAEQRYIDEPQRQTIARDPGCKVPTNNQLGATLVHCAPPRALLSALGVLRRRGLPADRSTGMVFRNGFDAGAGVYVDYIAALALPTERASTSYQRPA